MRGKPRKAAWNWAVNGLIEASDDGSGLQLYSYIPLLPTGRVKWLCDTRGYDSLTHVSTLLWLDLIVYNAGFESGGQVCTIPPLDLFIIKEQQDESGTEPVQYLPFQAPTQPSAYASWYTGGEQEDGLDPFLWTHHMGFFVANSVVESYVPSFPPDVGTGNSTSLLSVGNYMTRTVRVAAEWQPDVVVRSKRRLTRTDGLNLGISWLSLGSTAVTGSKGLLFSLAVSARMLLR